MEVIVNGHIMRYTEAGSADRPVVIFIHGFPFNQSMWHPQIEALRGSFRVITYDIRGHGDSEFGRDELSIALFAEDLIGLMDELEIPKAIVCGLSMGGYIALRAITVYPDRFSALILSDTQCVADSPEARTKRIAAIENIKKHGVEEYAMQSLNNLLPPETLNAQIDLVTRIKDMILSTSRQTLCDTLMALANREETCTRLSNIQVPALILVGSEDKITPLAAANRMYSQIPNAKMHVIEGAGHLPNMEKTEAFNGYVVEFLRSLHV